MTAIDPRLAAMFRPRSVAVVGATEDRNRVGGRPRTTCAASATRAPSTRSTRSGTRSRSLRAYASLADLPEAPDVAVIAVGGDHVQDVLRQCAARGVHSVVVMSSGFGETGPEGMQRQAALVAEARALGVRLVGPNAQGIANFQTGAVLNFSTMFMEVAPQDEPVAVISQSGAASVMPYALLRERGIGVRYGVVASGNDADASVNELALAAAADPDIAMLLYIESLTDPDVLAEAARIAQARSAPWWRSSPAAAPMAPRPRPRTPAPWSTTTRWWTPSSPRTASGAPTTCTAWSTRWSCTWPAACARRSASW